MKRPVTAAETVASIRRDLRALSAGTTPAVRKVRKAYSKRLAAEGSDLVLGVVDALLDRGGWAERVVALELLAESDAAFRALDDSAIEEMGRGLADWGSVDLFGVTISGPAWREHLLSDETVEAWARSSDRWRRRLALVSTVALNARARGARGPVDARRTLRVCRLLLSDRDPMVVKAMSWALRELAKRDSSSVESFLASEHDALASLVRREVKNKLDTGRKSPRKRARQAHGS